MHIYKYIYVCYVYMYIHMKMARLLRQESQKTITNYHKFSIITCGKLERSDWPVNALNDRPLFESLSICSSTAFVFVNTTHTDAFDFMLCEHEVKKTLINKHKHRHIFLHIGLRPCRSTYSFCSIRLSYPFSPQRNIHH